jgi:hypothetical protein
MGTNFTTMKTKSVFQKLEKNPFYQPTKAERKELEEREAFLRRQQNGKFGSIY